MMFAKPSSHSQKGVAVLEFTIVSTVFLILLFGIIEIGRFLFSLQMLNEITRKAARLGAVCYIVDVDSSGIGRLTSQNTDSFGSTLNSPIDLSTLQLDVVYLDPAGSVVTTPKSDDGFDSIRYVQAKISGFSYSFSLLGSLFGTLTNVDAFETTLPIESLGIYRPYYNDAGVEVTSKSDLTLDCQSTASP
ncbi:hypothetical protein VIN01S_25920 [Vibrio inusitatus NBRC 102082]|uniref:TadE-like domain-containing protein n=1 Tax=Vibrio inusitatus NBRC 102082 TaxID=1219070 RepID=A0A4Y3HXP9_9VIBR|nr:TadE/TadG family type IV pilus assembly protein [Vibrio inusitatus]GEA51788.1 hypothetical protein VIN01S_25920 [Vibrio inusitatus NBRC 102082]